MASQPSTQVPIFTYRYVWLIALTTLSLGLALLVLPGWIGHLFFNNGESSVNFFVRMLGSTLIGYSVLCFIAVKTKSLEAYKLAVWANLSTLLIATIVSIAYRHIYSGYGWLVIGQHVIFSAGFLYAAWELSKLTPPTQ